MQSAMYNFSNLKDVTLIQGSQTQILPRPTLAIKNIPRAAH